MPCNLTVKELIDRVGCPKGPGTEHLGITEMVALGGYFWTAGSSWAQGSDDAKKTLAEVGWTQRRSDDYPIWLVMKGA